MFTKETKISILHIITTTLCLLPTISTQESTINSVQELITRAGHNVTLPCDAVNDTYVLLLEWRCTECEFPGKSSGRSSEVRLVEYKPESTTLFRHEGRMIFQPPNFDLAFRPVQTQDSGQYNCVVNQRRKTIINLLVQDVPDPPGRPLIMGFSSRTVNLSWTSSQDTHHSPITHYIVHIRQGEEGRWDIENGRATRSNATQVTVTGLAPFTVYSFRVVAVNAMGQSNSSKESYYIVTLRELPEGKPIFTAAHNSSSTSVQLFWKPPPSSTIHGEFLGYQITLRPRSDGPLPPDKIIKVNIKDPAVDTYVVRDLKPYTQYLVSLQVFNPQGSGPASTVAVMTDEGVPGPPENLTVTRVDDTSVDLSWLRPHSPNGEVRGYRVYYMRGNFTSVRTDHGDLQVTNFTLNNLEPNSLFKIWTKAFTSRHEGESSSPVVVETDVSKPNAPIIVNLTCQSDSTLFIHWRRPPLFYAAVHLYYIYYRAEDAYQFDEIVVNSSNNKVDHNFLITNLSVNTMYEVKLRAGTHSRNYSDNNLTYKGPFSESRKILLFPDCHHDPVIEPTNSRIEMSAGIVAGIICAGFAIFFILVAMLIFRYFRGSRHYMDDSPKMTPTLMHDWENDSGGEGSFGAVDVHDFAKHVQELHADGDIGFSKEYEAIQAASAQEQHSAEHSHHPDNKQKNRYLNIVAYDHTRVPLRPLPGQKKATEYVNANYIDGYDKPRAYIGTQGPLPSTFDTFWRMVWEQRVHIIVMITNLVERGRKKCDQYWPKEGNENYGFIQVTLLHEEVLATYTIRKLSIRHLKVKCKKSGGGERIIYHYHYTNWPDHGTPDHPLPVLSFVRKSAAANPEDAGPIIVHCSAGVGRTGTYIVLDAMLQQIRIKGVLNIWGFLKHIRTQRNFLVQTEEQYIFIHDALLEAIQSGDTCVTAAGLPRYIKMLQVSSAPSEKDAQPWFYLQHQHKLVTNFQPRDFNVVSAVKPVNREKNRSLDHLPMENGRVHLTPKPGVDGSDYINATWLMGHQRLREFILTQHPLPNTILDFWQMVWDHNAQTIVVLTSIDAEKNFPQFWPLEDDDYDTEHWKVRFLEEKLHSGLATVEVAVQSTQDDYELPVRLIHAPDWPNSLPSLTTTLSLVSLVQEITTNYQNGPLLIVDKYGGTEGGIFCILSTLKNQVEFEHHLDPFMYFKLYHNRRPSLWHTQDDLIFVYRAMESHLSTASNGSDSSSDLAGFSDATITMPPITTFPSPVPTPITILHQLVQETQKQLNVDSSTELLVSSDDTDLKAVPSPVSTLPAQSPYAPTAPVLEDLLDHQSLPGQLPSSSQVISPGPANGFATLTGNGNLRVPPEGMEDAPLVPDVPPV